MKKSTFNYIADILREYPDTAKYIKKRVDELKYPAQEEDINADIQGSKTEHDPHINWLIKLEQDRRLRVLERNHMVISELLDECDKDTKVIIEELYFRKWQRYTMQGLVDNKLIFCSYATAKRSRNKFFEYIAKELEML